MPGDTIVTLRLESTTPLWPGGPLNGQAYTCSNTHNCIGPFLPDSKQLIGRLRWMLRAIEASIVLLQGKPPRSLGMVERLASTIFGSTRSASKLVVGTTFTYQRHNIDYVDTKMVKGGLPSNFVEVAEIMGYSILRRRLGLPEEPRLPRKASEHFNNSRKWLESNMPALEGLYRLLTISRVRLALQASQPKLVHIYPRLPLRPAFKLEIQLRRRLGASLSRAEMELVEALIPYTLTFMGLGKATSRGFGRFRLKEVEGGPENPHVEECIEKLKNVGPESLHYVFRDCGCSLLELAAEAIGYEGFECNENLLEEYKLKLHVEDKSTLTVRGAVDKLRRLGVPALLVAIANSTYIGELKHPCPYTLPELSAFGSQWPPGCLKDKRSVSDIVDALSAVGKATLKSTWKYCHGRLTGAGPAYHTWALGLPRSVAYKKKKIKKKIYTGYFLVQGTPEERCGVDLPKLLGDQPSIPRRLSPLAVTAACSNGKCSALLEPFITALDFMDKLPRLVHVGRHDLLYHIVPVERVLESRSLGETTYCPRDPGGVALAGECDTATGTYAAPRDGEIAAQLAALDWVGFLLS